MNQTLFIITGAAGTGKTTVCHYLCSRYSMSRVITHTTRKPRKGEQNGKDYYFETPTSFDKLHLLEAVNYSGAQYGSSEEGIEQAFAKKPLACIVLDTAGTISYLEKLHLRIVVIFLRVAEGHDLKLKQRMQRRGDSAEQIKKRLASKDNQRDHQLPKDLLSHATVIQNDDWKSCKHQLNQLVEKVIIS